MPFRARCNPCSLVQRRHAVISARRARLPLAAPPNSISGVNAQEAYARRHNSTSSLFSPLSSFFSRSKGQTTPSVATAEEAGRQFAESIKAGTLEGIQRAYTRLASSADPTARQHVTADQVLQAMSRLAESEQPGSLDLLRRMCDDLPTVFHHAAGDDRTHLLMRGLANHGQVRAALELAQGVESAGVNWRFLLRSAAKHDPASIEQVLPCCTGINALSTEDYQLVFRTLRNSYTKETEPGVRETLHTLLSDLKAKKVWLDWSAAAELMRVYLALGELDKAQAVVDNWDPTKIDSPGIWNAKLEMHIARSDVPGVEDTVRLMRNAGYDPSMKAVLFFASQNLSTAIASRSSVGLTEIVNSIESAEKTVAVDADCDVWADMLRQYLAQVKQHDALDVAVQIYFETLSRGIVTSAEMAKNLIIPLCSSRKQIRLDSAMRVYDDFTTLPAWANDTLSRQDKTTFSTVYQYLLVACARSVPPAVGTAIRLLSDMREHYIDITSTNLVSLLILLMKSSGDHAAAFNIYAHFYALDPSAIDEQGYQAILTSYLNLSWEGSPFPPPEMFVDMMRDMRRAGYTPGSHVLSSLLKQYGHTATRLRRKLRSSANASSSTAITASSSASRDDVARQEDELDALSQSIRDVHTLIKLDPMISPDIPVFSALMDAYARAGAYSECFEVWDELVQRRPREPAATVRQSYAASINVILDACGWSYSLVRARKAWAWARRWDLIWEKKQYEGWVECLCRNGQIGEAAQVVLDQMGREGRPEPDVESARIVVKFGRREVALGKSVRAVEEFTERVRIERPEWYDQLRQDGEWRQKA
ncbi:hypothetical protein IAU60_003236 [Kwoniella sp. DSM 27419]